MITFKATPYVIAEQTVLSLPPEASNALPSRGQVMVRGTLNGHPLETPLEPDGRHGHWFKLDGRMQRAFGITAGDTVTLELEPTKDWPEPEVPADVQAALDADPHLTALWLDVTPMARWEWLRWIGATMNAETRGRRIEVAASKLRAGSRRPCCFNRNMCCVPEVSRNGVLLSA